MHVHQSAIANNCHYHNSEHNKQPVQLAERQSLNDKCSVFVTPQVKCTFIVAESGKVSSWRHKKQTHAAPRMLKYIKILSRWLKMFFMMCKVESLKVPYLNNDTSNCAICLLKQWKRYLIDIDVRPNRYRHQPKHLGLRQIYKKQIHPSISSPHFTPVEGCAVIWMTHCSQE